MRKIILILFISILLSACTIGSAQNEKLALPSPTPNDFGWQTRKKLTDGITFADAKAAIEADTPGVRAISVFDVPDAEFSVAVAIAPDGTQKYFSLRPFSSDGTTFFWKAANMSPRFFYELITPNKTKIISEGE